MELLAFTKIVAKDMLNNKLSSTPEEDRARSILTYDGDTSRTAEEIRTSALEALLEYATVEHSHIEDLSTITQSTLATPTITEEQARYKRNHELINCTDFIASRCRERDGTVRPVKRRRRGKCVSCARNTSWHCPTCVPTKSMHTKYWCCNNGKNECHDQHMSFADD